MRFRPHISARIVALSAAIACALLLQPMGAWAKGPSRNTQRLTLRSYAVTMSNNSLRYLHTAWFNRTYSYQTTDVPVSLDTSDAALVAPADEESQSPVATETIELLVPSGGFSAGEVPIRSQGSALCATAIALKAGYYDPKRVGVARSVALRRTVAWTNALALSYQRDGWGEGWQSALWVYYLGFGARQEWSSLPTATQEMVTHAVTNEADHLLTVPPPFMVQDDGLILTPGDSKSEEDAWNASLLMLAAREWPDQPDAPEWEQQARAYMLVAYATPDQIGADPRILGSNLDPDGTVVNHAIVHPDYMMADGELQTKVAMVAAETNTVVPWEARNNFGLVWQGLTQHRFLPPFFAKPGGTIYRRGPHTTPTDRVYYPQGAEWSAYRRFNAADMDVEAFGAKIDPMAYGWAKAHMLYVLAQQRRHADRRIFSGGQTRFPEDEQFAAMTAAEMVYRLSVIR